MLLLLYVDAVNRATDWMVSTTRRRRSAPSAGRLPTATRRHSSSPTTAYVERPRRPVSPPWTTPSDRTLPPKTPSTAVPASRCANELHRSSRWLSPATMTSTTRRDCYARPNSTSTQCRVQTAQCRCATTNSSQLLSRVYTSTTCCPATCCQNEQHVAVNICVAWCKRGFRKFLDDAWRQAVMTMTWRRPAECSRHAQRRPLSLWRVLIENLYSP